MITIFFFYVFYFIMNLEKEKKKEKKKHLIEKQSTKHDKQRAFIGHMD